MRTTTLPSFDELDKVFFLNMQTGELTRRSLHKTKGLPRKPSISGEYRKIRVNGKQHAEHRIVFVLANQQPVPNGMEVDHINLNKHDNRPENLRLVTRAQNMVNMQKLRNNTTGFKGVYYCRDKNRYKAQIGVQNTRRKLGSFYTAEEAGRAYDVAAIEVFGEHALTNVRLGLFPAAPAITAGQQVLAPAMVALPVQHVPGSRSYLGVPDMPLPIQRCVPVWSRPALPRAVLCTSNSI